MVHRFQYFVVLGRAQHSPFQKKGSPVKLIGARYVECLVGNNITNKILNENFNGCIYLELD